MLNNKSTKAALQVTMTNGRRDVDTHTHKKGGRGKKVTFYQKPGNAVCLPLRKEKQTFRPADLSI